MRRRRLIILTLLGAASAIVACGTSAVGVDDCRTIEDALCTRAADLKCTGSVSESTCSRFYDTACLHGLVTTASYTKLEVTSCVDAIHTGSCVVVDTPQSAPDAACAWLIPPEGGLDAAVVDAAVDATSDATTDAGDGS